MLALVRQSTSLAVVLLSLTTGLARADRFEPIREMIRQEIAKKKVPSIAVAVAHKGEIVWEEAFGFSDVENQIPAAPRTKYSLASISKPITATALMTLVESGKIQLDRPIEDYLGGARLTGHAGRTSEATVRRVAAHTSGLPLHYHFFLDGEPHIRPPMAETIRRYGILVTRPGEKFQYANLGYGLIEYAIEQTSGESYADYVRENVFETLGMEDSDVPTEADPGPHRAVRYQDGEQLPFYDFDHRGGSAVFTSAHDLVRFGMFHLKMLQPDQESILPDRRIDEMQKALAHGAYDYGIGWMIYPEQGDYRLVHHGGVMGGVRTNLSLIPSEKVAVAVMANQTSSVVDQITGDILTTLLPGYKRRDREERPGTTTERASARTGTTTQRATPLPKKWAGTWRGVVHTYEGKMPVRLSIDASGKAEAQLGQQEVGQVSELKIEDGYLTGRFAAEIDTPDARERQHDVRFSLTMRGDTLSGALTAISLPGPKLSNALTSWMELARQ